jgi:hypothetical protein
MNCSKLTRKPESETSSQNDNDNAPARVDDFNKLRRILSRSRTCDVYCRSSLYFAFTGRGTIWTIRHGDDYLVLVRHPNIVGVLLVFFPFISDAIDLVEQVQALYSCKSFLKQFQEVLLARIPESVAREVETKAVGHNRLDCKLKVVNETKLDWAYPSYDICLERLAHPEGGKLKTYRKKVRKFCDQGVETIKLRTLDLQERRKAVSQVNASWIQSKINNGNSFWNLGGPLRDLKDPYDALAQLNSDITLEIDGLILKRKGAYVAFSLWERPRKGDIVPCMAALPCSYERGLSEYLYCCIAHRLRNDGYRSMCIGGSETNGLDQFKQKLDPIGIHKLRTIRLSPRE